MSKKREFDDGAIVKFFNYVWWFLLANFYFWVLNIPFIFVVLGMMTNSTVNVNMIIIAVFSSIPMGPALTALLSLMGKLTRDGYVDVKKDFFKAYKINFKQSVFFWIVGMSIITLSWIELLYFKNNHELNQVGIIPLVIILICIALGVYIFPLISRFHLKKKEVLIFAILSLFKKSYICIVSIVTAYILWIIFIKIKLAIILLLFFVSIICYLVMLLEKGMIQDIEEKYNNKDVEVQ